VDWHVSPATALGQVDQTIERLAGIVDQAGVAGCDVLAFPEDTLGALRWEDAHKQEIRAVLIPAVARMLERLGRAASAHHMYLVCSSDVAESDGSYRNAAFFLGRDGREIGRYIKVHPTITESDRMRGASFPVFETPDLGTVGMLICYDMVMPESTRVLALNGAGLVFVSTMGGAVTTGDAGLDLAAFRVRAVDNYLYLVIAKRDGAIIISPQGEILAETKQTGGIAAAFIDPFDGRAGGDAANSQKDMRARLFRERNPEAYGALLDPNPPLLRKIPPTISVDEAVRISSAMRTVGEEAFEAAESLARAGKSEEAARAFAKLRRDYPGTWIEREAARRLKELHR
jgi:predicted amidohydrolase